MNWYNIFIRTNDQPYYLLALPKDMVDDIVAKFNSGIQSLTVLGRLINFNDINRFLIYVISDKDIICDEPGIIRKKIQDISRNQMRYKKMNTSVLNFIGHEVTDEFEIRDFHSNSNNVYIDTDRLIELKGIKNPNHDLQVLIAKCEELNLAYKNAAYFSVAMLVRSIIDHIPPIFDKKNFSEVSSQYSNKSFKDVMIHLEKSSRKIADSFLHNPIRRQEVLPSSKQVDFSRELDVLLGEIIRTLK